jgi:hypothetical protein
LEYILQTAFDDASGIAELPASADEQHQLLYPLVANEEERAVMAEEYSPCLTILFVVVESCPCFEAATFPLTLPVLDCSLLRFLPHCLQA